MIFMMDEWMDGIMTSEVNGWDFQVVDDWVLVGWLVGWLFICLSMLVHSFVAISLWLFVCSCIHGYCALWG